MKSITGCVVRGVFFFIPLGFPTNFYFGLIFL